MIRHAPSIGLGLGLSLRGYGVGEATTLDPDVLAFAAESGATDLTGLNDLVVYLKGEGLYSDFVIYPMKSAQNAGSGPTVYSLGGLTTNDMALVSTPSWDVTGITFDGVADYGHISDFLGTETITVFARVSQATATPTATETLFGQYDSGTNERSFALFQNGAGANDPYRLNRSLDGLGAGNIEIYEDGGSNGSTSDRVMVGQWVNGGGRSLWIDNTSISVSLAAGMAQTARFNSSADITFFSALNSGAGSAFAAGLGTAFCVVTGTLTTTQRETVTDYINAL